MMQEAIEDHAPEAARIVPGKIVLCGPNSRALSRSSSARPVIGAHDISVQPVIIAYNTNTKRAMVSHQVLTDQLAQRVKDMVGVVREGGHADDFVELHVFGLGRSHGDDDDTHDRRNAEALRNIDAGVVEAGNAKRETTMIGADSPREAALDTRTGVLTLKKAPPVNGVAVTNGVASGNGFAAKYRASGSVSEEATVFVENNQSFDAVTGSKQPIQERKDRRPKDGSFPSRA